MKTNQGSGLVFAVVLLFVILGMVVTLSSVTILETKMNQKTKSSVGAFYNADSGVEWALNKIAKSDDDSILNVFGAGNFNPDGSTAPFANAGYKVYLLDNEGKVITNSSLDISNVKAVRAVGTQGGETQRAIEAAVAETDGTPTGTLCGVAFFEGDTNGNYTGNLQLLSKCNDNNIFVYIDGGIHVQGNCPTGYSLVRIAYSWMGPPTYPLGFTYQTYSCSKI